MSSSLSSSSRIPMNVRHTEQSIRSLASTSSSSLLSSAQRSPHPSSIPSSSPSSLDDRSLQIADYVEKRRQAKMNAETIKRERAREAELRKMNGGANSDKPSYSSYSSTASASPSHSSHPSSVHQPSPPSSSIPRSGIVRGDQSAPSSESNSANNSASSSRRASRGRDSGEWDNGGLNGRRLVSRYDEEEEKRTAPPPPVHDDDDDDDQGRDDHPSLHRYAKPTSRPTPPAVSSSSTTASLSSSSPSYGQLAQRVTELEAHVTSLEKQQKLFLAFMETTQAQLALMRGGSGSVNQQNGGARTSRGEGEAQKGRRANEVRKQEEQRRAFDHRQEKEEEEDDREVEQDPYSDRHSSRRPEQERRPAPPSRPAVSASASALPPSSSRRPASQFSADVDPPSHTRQPTATPSARSTQPTRDEYSPSTSDPRRSSHARTPSRSPPPPTPPPPTHSSSFSAYDPSALEDDPFPVIPTFPCPSCGRRFNELALSKHTAKGVCQKGPRKAFDVKAQRLGEVQAELSQVQVKGGGEGKAGKGKEKVSKWRQERARLQEAIQAGKAIDQALKEGKSLASVPVIASSLPDDRVQCPYCLRKFAENTADRHIPHCKNTQTRMKPTAGNNATTTQRRR